MTQLYHPSANDWLAKLIDSIDETTPLMVADGMGVNSTALLCLCVEKGIRPDAVVLADTGAEKPETYAYITVREAWLQSVGFPALTIVRYEPQNFKNWPPYRTLAENCFTNGTLPGISFGRKTCSRKWKIDPQNFWASEWMPAVQCWAEGKKVRKMIGYDASPADSRRYAHAEGYIDDCYDYLYPLRDARMDRDACIKRIQRHGLPVPPKSACFMCGAMKPWELHTLSARHLRSIVVMEARAHPRLLAYAEKKGWPKGHGNPIVEGLWRKAVKGMRGATPHPGQMTQYIRDQGLLPASEIDFLWEEVPKQLIRFQEEYARGTQHEELSAFLRLLEDPEPALATAA